MEADNAAAAAWVLAIAHGDRGALGRLYDRYAPLLLGLGIRMLRDRREAEDVLHDVFVEVWRHAPDFDHRRGRVLTWLVVRTRSRAIDVLRSARVRLRCDDEGGLVGRACAGPEPGDQADRQHVRAAVALLSPPQRQVLELSYFDGLSCSQMAAHLGIPVGTVKSRLAAALRKLRQDLGVVLVVDAPVPTAHT